MRTLEVDLGTKENTAVFSHVGRSRNLNPTGIFLRLPTLHPRQTQYPKGKREQFM